MSQAKISRTTKTDGPVVYFPQLQNGLDYLQDVVDQLTWRRPRTRAKDPEPGPRQLKYAVLHLQAAAEVLLKARLAHEHWSLMFQDLNKASRTKFEAGDFASCNLQETIRRLRDIAGVEIGDPGARALEELAKSRNALQHYGLSDTASSVEARAAVVLDFLLDFIHKYLIPVLGPEDPINVDSELGFITEGITQIRQFVTKRMARLRDSELKGHEGLTVQCPSCAEWAVLLGDTEPKCLLCTYRWYDVKDLCQDYSRSILKRGYWWWDELPPQTCEACDARALMPQVRLVDNPEAPRLVCMACGIASDLNQT